MSQTTSALNGKTALMAFGPTRRARRPGLCALRSFDDPCCSGPLAEAACSGSVTAALYRRRLSVLDPAAARRSGYISHLNPGSADAGRLAVSPTLSALSGEA